MDCFDWLPGPGNNMIHNTLIRFDLHIDLLCIASSVFMTVFQGLSFKNFRVVLL